LNPPHLRKPMLKWFIPYPVQGAQALGLLLFRLVIGSGLLLHGRRKLKHPTNWMQLEGTPPGPPAVQAFAALVEFGSGTGYLLGLLSPLAGAGMLMSMIGALVKVHIPNHSPFVDSPGKPSAESCLFYAAAAILLLLVGPGKYSADQLWTSRAALMVLKTAIE
jgi:putative oxidoreductase